MNKLSRPLPVLLERDEQFPAFAELAGEIERLDGIYRAALLRAEGAPPGSQARSGSLAETRP
jgi:uncharacterized protein (UPF0276 family)